MFERVTVNEDLSNLGDLSVNVLKFFRSNIFTLRKLENIFCAINNLYSSVWQNDPYVTRVYPSILSEGFLGFLGIFEVSLERTSSLELDLTSWGVIC